MRLRVLLESINKDDLVRAFGDKLVARFQEDRFMDSETTPEAAIEHFQKFNPTKKHEVLRWIIKTYIDGA